MNIKAYWSSKVSTGMRKTCTQVSSLINPFVSRFLRQSRRRKVFAILSTILILLTSVQIWNLLTPPKAEAAWFDDAWSYRKQITFGNSGAADSNKKVKFDLDTAALITQGKMQSDCDDARFTDGNGAVLRFFEETSGAAADLCNGSSTDFWVLIPTIVSGDNLLFFYYGNTTAANASEAANFSQATFTPTSGPTVAAEEKGPSPQMYLKFDEGVDNTCSGGTNDACDQTSFGNSGAISGGAAWKTEDLCLSGKCVFLDGTDDVVTVTNTSSIDLDAQLAGAFTFQAWIRPNGAGEGTGGQIFYKGTNTWLRVDTLSSGKLDIEASLDLATTDATLNVSQAVDDNRWTHVAVAYTDGADDEITIYVNGNNVGSSTNGVGAPAADTNNLLIGGITTNNFKGFIDEFKIYKSERTAAEIKTDFVKGTSSLHGVQAAHGIRDYAFLSDGLVGYWKMDDAGVDAEGEISTDSSGNGNSGTLFGNNGVGDNGTGMNCTAGGKYGTGCDFDGTDDYVSVSDDSDLSFSGDFTITAWVKLDRLGQTAGAPQVIARKKHTTSPFVEYELYQEYWTGAATEYFIFSWYNSSGTLYRSRHPAGGIATGKWYHLTAVKNASNVRLYVNGDNSGAAQNDAVSGSYFDSNDVFTIGSNVGFNIPTDGKIDDLRIYNRALSSSEISTLYNWAPGPVGYWNFDENTGTTANDTSGNANTGTLTNGPIWTAGKFGQALNFDGANDRVAIGDPANGSLDFGTGSFTYSLWVYVSSSAGLYDMPWWKGGSSAGTTGYDMELGTGPWNAIISDGLTMVVGIFGNESDFLSQWTHLTVVADRSDNLLKLYANGAQKDSDNIASIGSVSNASLATIGANSDSAYPFKGQIDEVKIYNYARTPSQIIEDMNADHPAPGSPIGSSVIYWKFDEATGTTANNSGTDAALDGTATGTAWRLENSTSGGCKLGGCQNVDTASDSISAGDTAFTDSLSAMTTSFWLNPQTLTVDDTIVSKTNLSTQNSFLIRTDSTNSDEIRVYIASSLTDSANYYTTNNLDLTAAATYANWQHITVVYDGTLAAADRVKVYKDAVLKGGSVTGTIPASMTSGSTSALRAGDSDITGSEALLTYLDELKIYNFALTSDQVKVDATAGSSSAFGGVLGTHDNEGFAGNPPVGWWKMDENTGTGSNAVKDSSGNNFHGTTNGSMTESDWVPGKFGSALDFDGSNDWVNPGDDSSLHMTNTKSMTFTAWVSTRGSAVTQNILRYDDCDNADGDETCSRVLYGVRLFAGNYVNFIYGTNAESTITANATFINNTWTHIAAVRDVSADTESIYINGVLDNSETDLTTGTWETTGQYLMIGRFNNSGGAEFFDGLIDDVRIYNSALSQAQVSYLFNRGGPIGYWKLDECSGTTAKDASGKGNNGTITPGDATGNNDSAGTCNSGASDPTNEMWNAGTTGKRNASLDFDGTNDYVSVTDSTGSVFDITEAITLSAWVNVPTLTQDAYAGIVDKTEDSGTRNAYDLHFLDSSNVFKFELYNNNTRFIDISSSVISQTGWYHVAATYDRSTTNAYIYLNRIESSSGNSSSAIGTNNEPITIGQLQNTHYFDGQIDEVRVYNYALTADQVKRVYNQGAIFFGPAEGSP